VMLYGPFYETWFVFKWLFWCIWCSVSPIPALFLHFGSPSALFWAINRGLLCVIYMRINWKRLEIFTRLWLCYCQWAVIRYVKLYRFIRYFICDFYDIYGLNSGPKWLAHGKNVIKKYIFLGWILGQNG